MKVVFLEDVEGTARVGDVKNVADGFARNYLLPRQLAAPATEHYINIGRAKADKEARRQAKVDEEARVKLLPKIEGRALTIEARVGEQGKLFGSVTSRDITEMLQKDTGIDLDHRQVELREAIKDLGQHKVTIRLSRNVQTEVTVDVKALGGVEPAPAEVVTEEAIAEAPQDSQPEQEQEV